MVASSVPSALVTVLTVNERGQVELERFEVEQRFRPVCVNNAQMYSVETHREGFSVRQLLHSAPVDIATWLHRSGLWDTTPPEA